MARIAGVILPSKKRIEVALTYIYGIGRNTSKKILTQTKVNLDKKADELTEEEEIKLREAVGNFLTEGDLKRKIQEDVARLQRIGTYRGMRHKRKLPARGQRTRTNARTKRGKRVTMGSGKRKETKK